MLSVLKKRLALFLFHTPTWNKSSEIQKIWEPLSKECTEALGTAAQAHATIDECRRKFSEKQTGNWVGPSGNAYDCFSEIERILSRSPKAERLLGHFNHVSYLGTNAISLGYVQNKHSSGYVLERLEALRTGLVVLRLHGVIVGAYPLSMTRIEMRRGMNIC